MQEEGKTKISKTDSTSKRVIQNELLLQRNEKRNKKYRITQKIEK